MLATIYQPLTAGSTTSQLVPSIRPSNKRFLPARTDLTISTHQGKFNLMI
jgi:hypothetical protein